MAAAGFADVAEATIPAAFAAAETFVFPVIERAVVVVVVVEVLWVAIVEGARVEVEWAGGATVLVALAEAPDTLTEDFLRRLVVVALTACEPRDAFFFLDEAVSLPLVGALSLPLALLVVPCVPVLEARASEPGAALESLLVVFPLLALLVLELPARPAVFA